MVALSFGIIGLGSMVSGALPPTGLWAFIICCFFMGGSGTLYNVPLTAYTQEMIVPEMMGKVFSLIGTSQTWTMPIGLLLAGPIRQHIGIDMWFFGQALRLVSPLFYAV